MSKNKQVHHPAILLVDDDPGQLELLSMRLVGSGYEIRRANSGEEALSLIAQNVPDLVIANLRMDSMDGLALYDRIHQQWPALQVVILTAHGSIREAVMATQKGVFAFLAKPVAKDELLTTLEKALELNARSVQAKSSWGDRILTRSGKMYHLLDQARLVARSDVNVLISGESGTGKELMAKAIHEASSRAEGPFVAVNCGALPDNLLESELFGHVKGAFTGATRDHPGLFAAAEGGSIFLDEIGDMPLALQVKLLRVLQERRLRPVGGTADRPIDVRILSATHRDLEEAVTIGKFREDLFYRLNVVNLKLPSLRERSEDIPLLVNHFLHEIAQRLSATERQIAPDAMKILLNYHWPGNIRQLQNIVEQLVALSRTPVISAVQAKNALPSERSAPIVTLTEAKRAFERDYLIRLLQLTEGNIPEAAKYAGRNRSDLYKVIKRHQIDVNQFK